MENKTNTPAPVKKAQPARPYAYVVYKANGAKEIKEKGENK